MLPGGSYEEVGRWLWNFATSHAKRESPRVEVVVEAGDEREGQSYGVRLRLRLGDRVLPAMTEAPVELAYPEVADGKTRFAWCDALAKRIRGLACQLLDTEAGDSSRSA